MGKFIPLALIVLLASGSLALYVKQSRTDQDKLLDRVNGISDWGKGVSDWSTGVSERIDAQRVQNDAVIRQLNAMQTTIEGMSIRSRAEAKTSIDEKKQVVAEAIKEESQERKEPLDEHFAAVEEQLPPPGAEDHVEAKRNLEQQRTVHQQIQDMAADPATAFSDPEAEKKARAINEQVGGQKDRVRKEVQSLEQEKEKLLNEKTEILSHSPLSDADRKRLPEIEKRLKEIEEQLKKKNKELDLLKLLGCLLKAVTYLGSFYADYQAPGSGEALRKLSEEIPCEMGGGGKGKDGEEDGGNYPPSVPPGPPPGQPNQLPRPIEPAKPSTGSVNGDTKDGRYEMDCRDHTFTYREKGQNAWIDFMVLTDKGLDLIKSGTVVRFDPDQKESGRKVVFVTDTGKSIDPAGKAVYMLFDRKDPEQYSEAFTPMPTPKP